MRKLQKTIVAYLLLVAMLIPMLPIQFTAFAEDSSESGDSSNIGKLVRLKYATVYAFETVDNFSTNNSGSPDVSAWPEYLLIEEEATTLARKTYYKLTTLDGSKVYGLNAAEPGADTRYNGTARPWVEEKDLEILYRPEKDGLGNVLLQGEVKLEGGDGLELNKLTLPKGGSETVFTDLSDKVGENPTYEWQIKIEDGRWAVIQDFVYPYAIISPALIANNPNRGGDAAIRCVATSNGLRYVSGEVAVVQGTTPPTEPDLRIESKTANADGDDPVISGFEITVQYIHRNPFAVAGSAVDGQSAYADLAITITDSSYTGEIDCPPVRGYDPYQRLTDLTGHTCADHTCFDTNADGTMDEHYAPLSTVKFDHVTTTMAVIVYYLPKKTTSFVVNIHLQRLEDDTYVLSDSTTHYGFTDSAVGEGLDVHWEGFDALYYDPLTPISAEGDTVIDIYYDRKYTLVDFELGAGYGVVPYYVRYGTQIDLTAPTNPGYTFSGWTLSELSYQPDSYDDPDNDTNVITPAAVVFKSKDEITADKIIAANAGNAKYDPSTAPALVTSLKNAWEVFEAANSANAPISLNVDYLGGVKYTAGYSVATTSYTLLFWVENADDDGYTLYGHLEKSAQTGDTVSYSDEMTRADRDCFTLNTARSDTNVVVKGDGTTAVNVYYLRNYYTIRFVDTDTGRNRGDCEHAHTHGDGNCDQYRPMICFRSEHEHTPECGEKTLICELKEHTHTDACCTITQAVKDAHKHTTKCYDNVGNAYTGSTRNFPTPRGDGYIYRQDNRTRYIYIAGTWYTYGVNANNGSTIQPNSDCIQNHVHGNGCIWKDTAHTHVDECYTYSNCTVRAHKHDDSCYRDCIKAAHTHNNASTCTTIKMVTRKYDADIGTGASSIWPIVGDNGYAYEDKGWWKSSLTDNYYVFLQKVPSTGNRSELLMTYEDRQSERNVLTWDYALEVLEGEDYDYTDNAGRKYATAFTSSLRAGTGTNLTYDEDYFPITGFKQRDATVPSFDRYNHAVCYYTRQSYNLIFNDGERDIRVYSNTIAGAYGAGVKFEAPLADYAWKDPPIPLNKETGSVKFVGWYTTNTYAEGTEFDFNSEIMPAGDVILYAKWEDCTYEVDVYADVNDATSVASYPTVLFGTRVKEPVPGVDFDKPNASYIFAGWYYDENGNTYRYDFNTMVVKKNLRIYAKWTSKVPVEFKVQYLCETRGIEIGDITVGQALAGTQKTFYAKVDSELYADYRTGHFPRERSYTMTIDADTAKNVYQFKYVEPEKMSYRVEHTFTNENFAAILGEGRNTFTFSYVHMYQAPSAVTAKTTVSFREGLKKEYFSDGMTVYVDTNGDLKDASTGGDFNSNLSASKQQALYDIIVNMSPDAIQKSIILQYCPDQADRDNTVTFTWEDRATIGSYQVIYYTQDLDGKTYSVDTVLDPKGNKGETYYSTEFEKKEIYGFTFDPDNANNVKSGTLPTSITDEPLILKLYYTRNQYSYTVQHQVGSEIRTEDTKVLTAYHQQTVTATANTYDRYHVVGADTQSITVTGEGNVITFIYALNEIQYVYSERYSGRGTLSLPAEKVAVGGTVQGSTPTPFEGYAFEGWYVIEEDAEGNNVYVRLASNDPRASVDAATGKITPNPTAEFAGEYITFYALFVPLNLVIRHNADAKLVYRIKGADEPTKDIDLRFALEAGGSVTVEMLPVGNYVITLETDWHYRYRNSPVSVSVSTNDVREVLLDHTNVTVSDQWLGAADHGVQ